MAKHRRGGYFWGIVFILVGVLLVVQNLGFNIDFWKYFWPILLILIGLSIFLKPSRQYSEGGHVVFDQGGVKANESKHEYSAVFGHGDFDFTDIKPGKKYEVSAVFGKAVVKIKKDAAVRINGSTAFGDVIFPDGKTSAFAERIYEKNIGEGKDVLEMKVSAVFGGVEILEV